MSIYSRIYSKLCLVGSQRKHLYGPGSGLHEHHIIPVHAGGSDDEINKTYLYVREHTIAHFLLWKINKDPNDLRSMYMLGANLSVEQRRIVGRWCRDNGIGFFGASSEERLEWRRNGALSQIETQTGIHVDDEVLRSEWASLGGKAGTKVQKELKLGVFTEDKELKSKWGKLGAAATPRLPVTNGVETIKFYTREERLHFLSLNKEYRIGYHKGKSGSVRR